jgi:hypothetical protein
MVQVRYRTSILVVFMLNHGITAMFALALRYQNIYIQFFQGGYLNAQENYKGCC